jgi:anti-sigma regulatory factor (Ser/Thr protein kinase)
VIEAALADEGHQLLHAPDGQQGLDVLAREPIDLVITDFMMPEMDGIDLGALRERVCDFLIKPFTIEDLRGAVSSALATCPPIKIDVVSARPNWVQLRIPCDLAAVPPLQKLLTQLKADLPTEMREAIAYAFREMLNNAIEHGGKLDPKKYVEVLYVRLERAVIYWIKDPGEGFDLAKLEHAAINNPDSDPFRHVFIRDEKGLRAGGFGILLTNQLVDELVYNERRNELMFIKYL